MNDEHRVFVCHDGQQVLGPFTSLDLQASVRLKELTRETLACEEGTEAWVQLGKLRPNIFRSRAAPPSARQQALMRYLGHPHPASVSSKEGKQWLDEVGANPQYEERLKKWRSDRFVLHPDLFEKSTDPVATERQQALMRYLGHPAPHTLSTYEASEWLDIACDDMNNSERLDSWRSDRLRLHPDLFAVELQREQDAQQERHANRPALIRAYCNGQKEDFAGIYPLRRLTHDHSQRAVVWLDANRPGWDAHLWTEDSSGINDDVISTEFFRALVATVPEAVKDHELALEWNEMGHLDEAALAAAATFVKSASTAKRPKATKRKAKSKRGCLALVVLLSVIVFLLLFISK
jgi:hypothetical protein